MRYSALIVLGLSASLAGCQASKPATGGAQVALVQAAMVEAARNASGPKDASRAVAAVAAHRGSGAGADASSSAAGLVGGGG